MARPSKNSDNAKDGDAHTELRKRQEGDAAATPLKPRTPVEKLPDDGPDDGDDELFNDMPV